MNTGYLSPVRGTKILSTWVKKKSKGARIVHIQTAQSLSKLSIHQSRNFKDRFQPPNCTAILLKYPPAAPVLRAERWPLWADEPDKAMPAAGVDNPTLWASSSSVVVLQAQEDRGFCCPTTAHFPSGRVIEMEKQEKGRNIKWKYIAINISSALNALANFKNEIP